MKLSVDNATITLQAAQCLRLTGARGVRLTCRAGLLWITQEGLLRDDFLAPGNGIEVVTGGLVLVEAMSESALEVARDARGAPASEPLRLAPT